MSPLAALFVRDVRLAVRVGGGAGIGVLFFLIVVVLTPFAIGPDLALAVWHRRAELHIPQFYVVGDADFLARGDNAPERFVHIFRQLAVMEVEPDGLKFDADSMKAERITEDADYEGIRVTFTAHLDRARIPIQIDIGFGDTVTPPPAESDYPTMLGSPSPRLLIYPKETVVAEKFEAMVTLGIANSRMKDFYDLGILSGKLAFDGKTLSEAIGKTFRNRETGLPASGMPLAFTPEFYDDRSKNRQWTAFCTKNAHVANMEFKTLIAALTNFLVPVAAATREEIPFTK